MDNGGVWFDVSAYMLFEATGDSEAECFNAAFELESDSAPPSEDDAQSCSYGSVYDSRRLREAVDEYRGADFDDYSGDEDDDSDMEDGVVDQCRRRGHAAVEKPAKSRACEDSNLKMINKREDDRQFWEACLAS